MITIVVDKSSIKNNIIEVNDKKEINHIKNSFRMKDGDDLRCVDGESEYITKIISIEKKEMICEIIETNKIDLEDTIVDIGLGLIKKDKMELSIQKLTEIGIDNIYPLKLDRSVVKVDEKKEKWDIIISEAMKQCKAIKFSKIHAPKYLKDIKYDDYDLIIVPYESEEDVKLKNVLLDYPNLKKVLYVIGSEGGFSQDEIEYLKKNGAKIVTLGNRILRAETAAIVVGGILRNEL